MYSTCSNKVLALKMSFVNGPKGVTVNIEGSNLRVKDRPVNTGIDLHLFAKDR